VVGESNRDDTFSLAFAIRLPVWIETVRTEEGMKRVSWRRILGIMMTFDIMIYGEKICRRS
jgi:hypothetical protein